MAGPQDLDLDASRATTAASRVVSDLLKSEVWQPAFAGAGGGSPLLVQRLDRFDDYYYIVPFLKDETVTGRLVIDARTMRVQEIGAIEKTGQSLLRFSSASDVLARLAQREERTSWIRFRIRSDLACVHPILLWKSCVESRSRLRPFHLVTIGDQTVYVRVDGKVFPSLTDVPDA